MSSLGKLLSGLPVDVLRLEIITRVGQLSMMIARHALLGSEITGGFGQCLDVYEHGPEFFLWCRENLQLENVDYNAGLSCDRGIIGWLMSVDQEDHHMGIYAGVAMAGEWGLLGRLNFNYRCPGWSAGASEIAVRNDRPDILQCIKNFELELNPLMLLDVFQYDSINCFKWIHQTKQPSATMCYHAAVRGSLKCLMHIAEIGIVAYGGVIDAAIEYNHPKILEWLHNRGVIISHFVHMTPFTYNRPDIVKWLHEHKYPLLDNACELAHNSLECLKYLRANGYDWPTRMRERATPYGSLQILQYMVEDGCTLSTNTFRMAIYSAEIDVLEWLHSKNCPHNRACENAIIYRKPQILRWLVKHGYLTDIESLIAVAGEHNETGCLEYLKNLDDTL